MRLRNKKRKNGARPEPETSSNTVINHWVRVGFWFWAIADSTTVDGLASNNPDHKELLLHFWRKRPGPWEMVNEDGNNLHQLMT